MIDLHCHLLPGIDDGASTLNQSLAMAQASVDDGISYAVVTPHLNPGRYENTRTIVQAHFLRVCESLKDADISLKVGMAAEVRIAPEILSLIDENQVSFLGELDGDQIVLLEFPRTHIPPGADKFVEHLLARKIRPLIAHPKRIRSQLLWPVGVNYLGRLNYESV